VPLGEITRRNTTKLRHMSKSESESGSGGSIYIVVMLAIGFALSQNNFDLERGVGAFTKDAIKETKANVLERNEAAANAAPGIFQNISNATGKILHDRQLAKDKDAELARVAADAISNHLSNQNTERPTLTKTQTRQYNQRTRIGP